MNINVDVGLCCVFFGRFIISLLFLMNTGIIKKNHMYVTRKFNNYWKKISAVNTKPISIQNDGMWVKLLNAN